MNEENIGRSARKNPSISPRISSVNPIQRSSSASVISFSGPMIIKTPKATMIAPPRDATNTMGAAMPYVAVDAPKDTNMIAVAFPKEPNMVTNRFEKADTMAFRNEENAEKIGLRIELMLKEELMPSTSCSSLLAWA